VAGSKIKIGNNVVGTTLVAETTNTTKNVVSNRKKSCRKEYF
jgi:hypothetical protein